MGKHSWRKSSAEKRGIQWGLTDDEVTRLFDAAEATPCPACGVFMTPRTKRAPTLDRVLNDRGYTPDNVAVICKQCNEIKRDLSGEQLYRLAQYVLAAEARRRI